MSDNTIKALVETRKRIVREVNQGKLSVKEGARLLGITRPANPKNYKQPVGVGIIDPRDEGVWVEFKEFKLGPQE